MLQSLSIIEINHTSEALWQAVRAKCCKQSVFWSADFQEGFSPNILKNLHFGGLTFERKTRAMESSRPGVVSHIHS